MDDSQKPFACTIEGCEMTFTNEDHLNWHHKKHDMSLNLGLANKNSEVADQTPTPTRFIRNCEEVGLFQDLQNVNPFDETFKKAIESVKSGTLHVPEVTTNDDTLHTPHIFPPVENTVNKYIDNRADNQSSDFCINSVTSMQDEEEPNESYDLTIVTEETEKEELKYNKQINLKDKLKETIKNKGKNTLVITPVPLEKLILSENDAEKRHSANENDENRKRQRINPNDDTKEKLRAMNRAAQLRCRRRKQIQWKKMEDDVKMLKNENTKLVQENQNFKHKFYALKELVVKHKKDTTINSTLLLNKIEEILNSEKVWKKVPAGNTQRNTPIPIRQKPIRSNIPISPLVPVPFIQNVAPAVQKPVVIQVMGSVGQLAVSVLPNK